MDLQYRILLVEDTRELREDLALELTDAGYAVIESCDGHNALAAIKTHRPDLVICDIQLPEVDGITILELIRADKHGVSKTPVIVVSAFSDSELHHQATVLGIEEFMVKPVDFSYLLNLIERTLEPDPKLS